MYCAGVIFLLLREFVQTLLDCSYFVIYCFKLGLQCCLVLAELFKTFDETVALEALCSFALVELGGIVVVYVPEEVGRF